MNEINMEAYPNYYAIIPANVRYDEDLKANEKLLYGEITALSQRDGKCWATNSYFAKLYGVSIRSIQKWIKNLEDKGYIQNIILTQKGLKTYRVLIIVRGEQIFREGGTKVHAPHEQKFREVGEQKFTHNNININNTRLIKKNKLSKDNLQKKETKVSKSFSQEIYKGNSSLEEIKNELEKIKNHWNTVFDRNFKVTTDLLEEYKKLRRKYSYEDIKQGFNNYLQYKQERDGKDFKTKFTLTLLAFLKNKSNGIIAYL